VRGVTHQKLSVAVIDIASLARYRLDSDGKIIVVVIALRSAKLVYYKKYCKGDTAYQKDPRKYEKAVVLIARSAAVALYGINSASFHSCGGLLLDQLCGIIEITKNIT
jgi:hypothetical protein